MYFYPSVLRSRGTSEIPRLPRRWGTSLAKVGRKSALRKILLPIDNSPASIAAVEYVIRQASEGLKVHLINVQPPIMAGDVSVIMSADMVADMRRAAGAVDLEVATSLLDANHIEYTAEVVFGSPAKAIVRCAVEQRCTKIVMGTKGRTLLGNLIARSVANRVVRLAHVPVTLVKERRTAAAQMGSGRTEGRAKEIASIGTQSSRRSPRRDSSEWPEPRLDLGVKAPPLLLEDKHQVGQKQQQVDHAQ